MKKVIVLLSGVIIAASAAAQADKTGSNANPAARTGTTVDRQLPVNNDKRENPAAEGPESANIVDPDFQGSSKQETTASGLGQPKKEGARASSKDRSDTQDVEDKTKQ